MNPNDTVRRQMLQYFYDRNAGATSTRGKKGCAVKISDVKRELKTKYGLKQQTIISNLTYLIDRRWVNKSEVQKTVNVAGGTIPSTVTWYEISALGIDKIEGGSEFEPKELYPGINLNASGMNVITLGDGNVVNTKFSELREHLDDLKVQITSSAALGDKQRLEVAADLESMKQQLEKESPDRTIVSRLWSAIERAAAVAGVVDAAQRVWPLISPLL